MKKLFTLITVLIALSLLGIIILQVVLIRKTVRLSTEQIEESINLASIHVIDQLQEEKSLFLDKNKFQKTDSLFNFQGGTIAEHFTTFRLQELIRKELDSITSKKLSFEFAIYNEANTFDFDLKSERFDAAYEKASTDKLNNLILIRMIETIPGSEAENLIPEESLVMVILDYKKDIFNTLGWMIAGALLFTMIILAAFYITVKAWLNQKKLTELTSDFINNMTHELKTPIATISIAANAIQKESVKNNPEQLNYFSSVISEENKRMNTHVENILEAAQFDRNEVKLNRIPVHVHDSIQKTVDSFKLQLEERNGMIQLNLAADKDLINADSPLFSNLLNNLLDNAIKYAKVDVPPLVKISTHNLKGHIIIEIEDNGIGMSRETQGKIFEKFYRAHTGNIHNVKGFGLGLSYVKSLVDGHKGKISLESSLGKGSRFKLEFPTIL
ncbi:MAG: sensor histidine kinase [Chitinophagaceae bacterium]|jgi:two-component system phosphate regulon sensor histidine kinase PhoR